MLGDHISHSEVIRAILLEDSPFCGVPHRIRLAQYPTSDELSAGLAAVIVPFELSGVRSVKLPHPPAHPCDRMLFIATEGTPAGGAVLGARWTDASGYRSSDKTTRKPSGG